jgi:hypothetical protein
VIIGSGAGGGAPFMVVINILWNLFSELRCKTLDPYEARLIVMLRYVGIGAYSPFH